MTAAAGFSNVTAIDGRLRIACSKDRRHVAISGMAIDTGRSFVSTLNSLSVKTTIICGVRVSMKFGAAEVGQFFSWRMTALALKIW